MLYYTGRMVNGIVNKTQKNQILCPENELGIYRYEYPVINGIRQYVQIRGENKNNPLLLFLHGGPGGSLAGICHLFQSEWEKHFTVVNWDQRNTCKTYFANIQSAKEIAHTGTIEDYVKDIDDVITYLHTVCHFEKLILLGFSWGSAIGAEYAKRHPENLACFISVGQLINYCDGVLTVCRKMLERVPKGSADEQKIQTILKDFPETPVWNKMFMQRMRFYSPLATKYIAKHAKRTPLGKILTSPFLSLKEKKAALFPNASMLEKSYETMLQYDFRTNLHFDVPILFLFGKEETVCPAELLYDCFDQIEAPGKRMEIIPRASHGCMFDQPECFLNILLSFTEPILHKQQR